MDPWANVELTHEEQKQAIDAAKKAKHYRQQMEAYSAKLIEEKTYPFFTADELSKIVQNKFFKRNNQYFILDKENEMIFKTLCLYFTGNPEFEKIEEGFSLRKGLMLFGGVGVGKTAMMQMFTSNQHASFAIMNCLEVTDSYSANGAEELARFKNLLSAAANHPFGQSAIGQCFDDLGTETIPALHFGDRKNVMAEIILGRYAQGIDYNQTHITTNLSVKELEATYGTRVLDRMSEMFNQISFSTTANSRRA